MQGLARQRRRCRGTTFVETLAALGIGALLLGMALPALQQFRQTQQLRARADSLAADLRLARAEAVRLSEPVYFRVSGKGSGSCYILHLGVRNGCDCDGGRAVCTRPGAAVIKAEWLPPDQPVRISSNAETLDFQVRQGLVTQTGSVELRLAHGPAIRQVIAITGRVRSCYVGSPVVNMPRCA